MEEINIIVEESPDEVIAITVEEVNGDPGYTPIKGIDYFDGYTPIKDIDYRDGIDGTMIKVNNISAVAGNVSLTTNNLPDYLNKRYVTDIEKTAITHANRTALDLVAGRNTGDETSYTILSKIGAATDSANGYLSKEDHILFKSKQPAGAYLTVETDPTVPSHVKAISSADIAKWNLGGDVSGKEDKTNKVTSISAASTNTQYPSAKLVYDQLAGKLSAITKEQVEGVLTGEISTHSHAVVIPDVSGKVDKRSGFGLYELFQLEITFDAPENIPFTTVAQWDEFFNFSLKVNEVGISGSRVVIYCLSGAGLSDVFSGNTHILTINSDAIDGIADGAFVGCSNLYSVYFNNCIEMSGNPFLGLTTLSNLTVGYNLSMVDSGSPHSALAYALANNPNLTEITYLKSIEDKIDLKVDKISGYGLQPLKFLNLTYDLAVNIPYLTIDEWNGYFDYVFSELIINGRVVSLYSVFDISIDASRFENDLHLESIYSDCIVGIGNNCFKNSKLVGLNIISDYCSLGSDTTDNGVFDGVTTLTSVSVPYNLSYAANGNPDGDLVYALANNPGLASISYGDVTDSDELWGLNIDVIALGENKEDKTNKVTSLSPESTDTQYPSALLLRSSLEVFPVDINRCGFTNRSETTISFDGTSIFTLAKTGTSWSYYRNGIKHIVSTSKTIDLTDVDAILVDGARYFIYIDSTDGTLSASKVAWTLLDSKIPVAVLAWNNNLTPKYLLQEERHSIAIDRAEHWYNHVTRGTQYISGGELTGYTVATNTDVANTFAIAQAVIADEDITQTLPLKLDATNYFCAIRGGSEWMWGYSDMPFLYNPSEYISWDNAGTPTQGSGGSGASIRYYNTFLILSNTQGDGRHMIVTGQHEYTTAEAAYAENIGSLALSGFPITEWLALYQFTWKTGASSLTNKGKCQLAREPHRIITSAITASVTSAVNHNLLSGLQGGVENEYYHLSVADVAKLNSGEAEIGWVDNATYLITGTDQVTYNVPESFNGKSISSAHCFVSTPSTSGLPTFVIRNLTTGQTITSTAITIDINEYNSYTATTAHVINPLYKVVSTGDRLAIDCTVSGVGTKGASTLLKFIP